MSDEKLEKLTAHCRFQVLVEVPAPGSYGPEWNLSDLMKQGENEGLNKLRAALVKTGITVVGEPMLTTVFMVKDKS